MREPKYKLGKKVYYISEHYSELEPTLNHALGEGIDPRGTIIQIEIHSPSGFKKVDDEEFYYQVMFDFDVREDYIYDIKENNGRDRNDPEHLEEYHITNSREEWVRAMKEAVATEVSWTNMQLEEYLKNPEKYT